MNIPMLFGTESLNTNFPQATNAKQPMLGGTFQALLASAAQGNQVEMIEPIAPEQENLVDELLGALHFINTFLFQEILPAEQEVDIPLLSEMLDIPEDELQKMMEAALLMMISRFEQDAPISVPLREANELIQSGKLLDGFEKILNILSQMDESSIKGEAMKSFAVLAKMSKAVQQTQASQDLSLSNIQRLSTITDQLATVASKLEAMIENVRAQEQQSVLQRTFSQLVDEESRNADQQLLQRLAATGESPIRIPAAEMVKEAAGETLGDKMSNQVSTQMNNQPLTKIEQFTIFASKDNKPVDQEQLIKQFTNILSKSQLMKTPNMNRLMIKLYPEHLGTLRVELVQQNGLLTARMLTSTQAAKEMLDSQLHSLRHAFSQQNIQVDKIDISYQQQDAERFERHQQGQHGQQASEQHKEEQAKRFNDEEEQRPVFSDALQESLLEMKV
ncbi:flagellar hook-length control protein FliK [Bacillus chungangensis]|uniref:Flagellar hook-length control protein FliK n=1 Tax=Bacillus chungangensis TaxID=587633 RepID=A0ABT9WRT1_9BACI|nr:flagellar hook-length control protein FliK [Bacillus chungangensis]MDQ0175819.1 flagellar hook-length control protein FliK [Bacillus chungangensis]